MTDLNTTKEYLSSKGIHPSLQRIKILEYIANHLTHPTVDEIYLGLVEEMPTLSKTTVYNTLKLFVDNKLVKLISIEDTETRYDVNMKPHGHFKCVECRHIYDFALDVHHFHSSDLEGYTISEKDIYFKGICKKCNDKK